MKKEKGTDRISTFIGADASIEGNIEFKGTIRVDGKVKGKISSNSGTVVVGENAVVNAEVFVNVAVIMGELNGTIDAKERIEVYPPGRVGGDIHAPVMPIEPGGVFNGNCVMKIQPDKDVKPAFFVKNQPQSAKPKEEL
jgi:cytoskeletal protein CcmA (bactofilin family)